MRTLASVVAAALTGTALLAAPGAARAQLFKLQDVAECLDHPESEICRERFKQASPPAAPVAVAPAPAPEPPPSGAPPKPEAKPTPAKAANAAAGSLDEILARIKAGKASGPDLDRLESFAEHGEPRAVEVLAWCYLNGKGRPADAMRAYWLYGRAAELKVPNARKNQVVVFEEKLTTEQRNEVLLRENTRGGREEKR
jgi:TPR repeat protein